MIVYKLMDVCRITGPEGLRWDPGAEHVIESEDPKDWIFAYEHPLLAMMHDPIHSGYLAHGVEYKCDPLLWEAAAAGKIWRKGQMQLSCTKLRTIREIPLPKVTLEQRVRYAIYCAQTAVGDDHPTYSSWAKKWLDGEKKLAGLSVWAPVLTAAGALLAIEAGPPLMQVSHPMTTVVDVRWTALTEAAAKTAALASAWVKGQIDLIALAERACA